MESLAPALAGGFFTTSATWEAHSMHAWFQCEDKLKTFFRQTSSQWTDLSCTLSQEITGGCAPSKWGSKPRNRETWETGCPTEKKDDRGSLGGSERRPQDDKYVSRFQCGWFRLQQTSSKGSFWWAPDVPWVPLGTEFMMKNKMTVHYMLVTQPCLTLYDPMDCIARQAPPSMGFFRQECWSGLPFPSPGDLPNPGIESGSRTLQADSTIWATRKARLFITGEKLARKALVIYNMVNQSNDFTKLEGRRDEKGAHERGTGKGRSRIFMEEQERTSKTEKYRPVFLLTWR